MSLIKWVSEYYDTPDDVPTQRIGQVEIVPMPVVPLSALTVAMSRVRSEWGDSDMLDGYVKDLLAQLEAHRKEGA